MKVAYLAKRYTQLWSRRLLKYRGGVMLSKRRLSSNPILPGSFSASSAP